MKDLVGDIRTSDYLKVGWFDTGGQHGNPGQQEARRFNRC